MNGKSRDRELRMEMLRMRAAIERGEVAASWRELRAGAGGLRNLASLAGSVGAAVAGRSGWVGLLASSATGRPWLAALALGAVRALKRRPLLAAAVVVGAVVMSMRAVNKNTGSQTPDA